jgi:hypothetical protein
MISSSVKRWEPTKSSGWRSLLRSEHCSLPPRRISPSAKKGLYRAILELLSKDEYLWSASSCGANTSLCVTRIQYMRPAASSTAVSSPADFSPPRTFCRNRRTHAVVRTSFQYELNLDASMRLALTVVVKTWQGSLLFSGNDLFVAS